MPTRLIAAFVCVLVLAMTLMAAGPAAVSEEVEGNEGAINAPQEEVALSIVELLGTISAHSGLIIAIAILSVLMIYATSQ